MSGFPFLFFSFLHVLVCIGFGLRNIKHVVFTQLWLGKKDVKEVKVILIALNIL